MESSFWTQSCLPLCSVLHYYLSSLTAITGVPQTWGLSESGNVGNTGNSIREAEWGLGIASVQNWFVSSQFGKKTAWTQTCQDTSTSWCFPHFPVKNVCMQSFFPVATHDWLVGHPDCLNTALTCKNYISTWPSFSRLICTEIFWNGFLLVRHTAWNMWSFKQNTSHLLRLKCYSMQLHKHFVTTELQVDVIVQNHQKNWTTAAFWA